MEEISSVGGSEIEPQFSVPLTPSIYTPPTLRDGECYHIFISYSSADSQWTHSIIDQMESWGLQVCYHERDFTPGRTVLENMTDCIKESQKVLLVLSSEFVKSRWCLLEANMSLFSGCLERKPIVPVLLEPEVAVPPHLCHITYLEANDHDFKRRLLKVLCTPNQQLQECTMVPFPRPSIYNGMALKPLTAVNKEGLAKWDFGHFDDMRVPDQLRMIIEDHNKYKEALGLMNSVSQNEIYLVRGRRLMKFLFVLLFLLAASIMVCMPFIFIFRFTSLGFVIPCLFFAVVVLMIQLSLWKKDETNYVEKELKKAIGQANIILSEEKVLMGFFSNSEIYLVYVSLHDCKHEFAESFSEQEDPEEMFRRALKYFSSGYAACLAKRNFTLSQPSSGGGHLEEGVCFCQYVSQQLSKDKWE